MLISGIYGSKPRKHHRRRKCRRCGNTRKDCIKYERPDEELLALSPDHSVMPNYYRDGYKH